ncbi:uncharacterized protein LOC130657232 [Hydractinia symbiolongicarpus]|uniref:uncharacterized protein LOC130657232 n=1 Tax=Hydractinia symbiolongicarpus TaxID=13093 RepID=UPI0025507E84|nr:uncharacterized protein LOC130657232 [Hydractinia symbiolongicarpus]
MKRSHSLEEEESKVSRLKYDGDGRLSGDFDKVSQHGLKKVHSETNVKDKNGHIFHLLENNNRMEQMEIENYSLRTRCKRLESIVTQLLENKGKTEDDEEQGLKSKEKEGEDIRVATRPYQDEGLSFSLSYESDSPSPPYRTNSPIRSIPPPLYFRHNPSYEVSQCHQYLPAPAKSLSEQVFSKHRPMGHIHIPVSLKEEHKIKNRIGFSCVEVSDPRHILRKTPSPSEITSDTGDKVKEKEKGNEIITPEEMEERNELFRATYYAHKTGQKKTPENNIYDGRVPRRHSPPYGCVELTESYSIQEKRSPKCFLPTYHRRYYPYDSLKIDRERIKVDEDYKPEMHQLESISYNTRDEYRPYYAPVRAHKATVMKTLQTFEARDKGRAFSPPENRTLIPNLFSSKRGYKEASGLPIPMPQLISSDPDFTKYNSDFYTKLPPKLHIVESQNENGVTLTWNATSNCDSSLVKSYQLFARELFGHKVGTMKRIGIVDALPLPMSCNIDKLKYNIKYKFAVCAVDIYGRFGKMSNFTGKFELKPKGALDEQDAKDMELRIVV